MSQSSSTSSPTPPNPKTQKRLKKARAEIEAVLKSHDIAGFIVLHAPDWNEVFWNIWPSYSVLIGDFPSIRIKSKLADYSGNVGKQLHDQAQTAQMISTLGLEMGRCAMQFLELSEILDAKTGSEHKTVMHLPDPSKLNPGTH